MAHNCTFVEYILQAMRLRIAFILMLLLFASASAQDNPNFIVILVDDQGWNGTSVQMSDGDPLSKSDYHQTPNLEKLASSGMRFSSAYASALSVGSLSGPVVVPVKSKVRYLGYHFFSIFHTP